MVSVAETPSRIHKILSRALDPAARDGEAENCAVMAIRHARRERLTLESFVCEIAPTMRLSAPPPPQPPPACAVRMPCGKYRGRTLAEIGRDDMPYLEWLSMEFSDMTVAQAAHVVLVWLTGGGTE